MISSFVAHRDKVLKNIGNVDAVAKEKSDEVRKRYEKKLQTMQKEMSKLQNAKREHQRLQKTKVIFLFLLFMIIMRTLSLRNVSTEILIILRHFRWKRFYYL